MRIPTRISLLLLMSIYLFQGAVMIHDFYVSLTELRYNPESSRMEVSVRIFPDDLDLALLELHGLATHLGTSLEPAVADSLIAQYIRHQFRVEADGKQVSFRYLGKEPEADAIWCYLESERIHTPRTLKVRNTILTEQFEDQVNIVQVYSGEWNRGVLLSREDPENSLHVGE